MYPEKHWLALIKFNYMENKTYKIGEKLLGREEGRKLFSMRTWE
jgi:hypothetical protein